ncbi:hypothetical protein ACH5RR_017912 [Cinchona calisaya]|uniref:Uncharacterized protein n=1 Tax=Cinchona calisaya TaxID=153742 RepID=A0ABD2ZKB0_9GENT
MGQIVRRKKKEQPSKAGLVKRSSLGNEACASEESPSTEREDKRRLEKKLELLLKLQTNKEPTPTESTPSETRRVYQAHAASQSSSDFDGGGSNQPSKKRKLSHVVTSRGRGSGYGDEEEEDEEDEGYENDDVDDDDSGNAGNKEVFEDAKAEPKGEEGFALGTPTEVPSGLPLLDKKTLELILDKCRGQITYNNHDHTISASKNSNKCNTQF